MDNSKKRWWKQLLAIPPHKDTMGFKRIERLIKDKTRGSSKEKGRIHEFYRPRHETHLTASLWENFAIFDHFHWVNALIETTGVPLNEKVSRCNWSYEWEKQTKQNGKRLCDIVIEFETESETKGVIVVEAKNLNTKISEKDTDIHYYLDLEDFADYDKTYLIYCVDETVAVEVDSMIQAEAGDYGLLTWQALGAIQLAAADKLEVHAAAPDKLEVHASLKTFIKASIYHQFTAKGILPQAPIAPYLLDEPSMEEYVEMDYTAKDMQRPIWKIGYGV